MLDTPSLSLLFPEILLLSTTVLILLLSAFFGERASKINVFLAQCCLLACTIFALLLYNHPRTVLLQGHFVHDSLSMLLGGTVSLAAFVFFLYAPYQAKLLKLPRSEFYGLALFSTLGMQVLISAHSLLSLYLGLELLSLPLYALIALQKTSGKALEAAMKYFVTGAIASGLLLYGISLIFGATSGSLEFTLIAQYANTLSSNESGLFLLATVFLLAGIAFKLGAVPFHMWVPDVYEGSNSSIALFIASAAKLTGLALALRLLHEVLPTTQAYWQPLLTAFAVASLLLGNLLALVQNNFKRLLAYSGIGHMGFILLGLMIGTHSSFSATIFYSLSYALSVVAGFSALIVLSRTGFEAESLDDLKGLHLRHPWLAFMLLLILLSMAGIPPTIGFYAKLSILLELITQAHYSLAVVAVLSSVIGLFYYLRIVKIMYFDSTENFEDTKVIANTTPWSLKLTFSLNSLTLLGIGLFPNGLMLLCHNTLQAF